MANYFANLFKVIVGVTWYCIPNGGLQNFFLIWVIYRIIRKCYQMYKNKKAQILLIIAMIPALVFSVWTLVDMKANIRFLSATTHPVIAYSSSDENMKITHQDGMIYDVMFRTGEKDSDGFPIFNLPIRVYKLGFIYFSRMGGNG